MAKFALISDADVVNVVVADSEEQIGVMADLFTVVDVTLSNPQPSVGWTYVNNMFYPPMLDETIRVQWNGGGFGEIIDADAVEELPAPAEEDSSDK